MGTSGRSGNSGAVWTLPNVISYVRVILLLPLVLAFIASNLYGAALITAMVLGFTDWLDGHLARSLGQQSTLGAELDPSADRAAIVLTTVAMVLVGLIPWVFLLVIAGVDVLLFVLAFAWFKGYPETRVTFVGKARTAVLLVGLPLLLAAAAFDSWALRVVALVLLAVGTAGHAIAGAQYFGQMLRHRQRERASASLKAGIPLSE